MSDRVRPGIGRRVRLLRHRLGMSARRLSQRCCVTESLICHLEAGRRNPSIELLVRLCRALDCSADFLLGRLDRG